MSSGISNLENVYSCQACGDSNGDIEIAVAFLAPENFVESVGIFHTFVCARCWTLLGRPARGAVITSGDFYDLPADPQGE